MPHNTGNASGSEDPRDLIDNGRDIDIWTTSQEPISKDRLGRTVLTRAGLSSAAGDATIAIQAAETALGGADRAEAAELRVQAEATTIAAAAVAEVVTAVDGAVAQAEGYAAAAYASGNQYGSTAGGLAGTADGQYFLIRTADPQAFEVYLNDGGAAVLQPDQFEIASNSRVKLIEESKGVGSGKNQFDPSRVREGFEINVSGAVVSRFDSSVSDLMYVFGRSAISLSGFQTPTAIGNYYRFLAEDQVTVVSVARKLPGAIPGSVAVPDGAYFFQICPRQRATDPGDYDSAQVEFGPVVTDFEPYDQLEVLYLGGKRINKTPLNFGYGALKNKFDVEAVTPGYEVYTDGGIRVEANSYISDFIDVAGEPYITISGLQVNASFPNRYYVFLADDKETIIGTGFITGDSKSIVVPLGSKYFRFSPKQRSAEAVDFTTTQAELNLTATDYEPFTPIATSLNGLLLASGATAVGAKSWEGRKLLAFGDSITETATVLNDGTYTEGVRSNWPKFIGPLLQSASVMSYAESGASFREYAGQAEWQKLTHQVERSVAHDLDADIIVVAAGTNDGTAYLGDYATAMSRAALGDLDLTKTIEAMRWVFWSIRTSYPLAECFAVLPIQRADVETSDREPLLDAITQMAKRYNFRVIDAHSESGIVKDFEVWTSAGRDLYDGLHPAESGQIKMARLIASIIKSTLM